MSSRSLPSASARNELQRLGENIAIARKRRRLTQKHLADAASVTPETIRSLERGNPGISIGTLAMVLLALGERGRLGELLAPPTDAIGMVISVHDLPKRVRTKRKDKAVFSHAEGSARSVQDGKYVGF
jgi:transcriptional regulator with XRE-family HTH domain